MARGFLLASQIIATFLFIATVRVHTSPHWVAWLVPLLLLILIAINSFWFSRLSSWLIFSGGFFSLLVLLSAFTLRWRLEPGFSSAPFYEAMGMYAAIVYAGLAQLKINSRRPKPPTSTGG